MSQGELNANGNIIQTKIGKASTVFCRETLTYSTFFLQSHLSPKTLLLNTVAFTLPKISGHTKGHTSKHKGHPENCWSHARNDSSLGKHCQSNANKNLSHAPNLRSYGTTTGPTTTTVSTTCTAAIQRQRRRQRHAQAASTSSLAQLHQREHSARSGQQQLCQPQSTKHPQQQERRPQVRGKRNNLNKHASLFKNKKR